MAEKTLRYRVHGVNTGQQPAQIEFEGATIDALVPSLSVELAWDNKDNRYHGSLALTFVGGDVAWARGVFVQDGEVDLSFEAVEGSTPVPLVDEQQPTVEPAPDAA